MIAASARGSSRQKPFHTFFERFDLDSKSCECASLKQ
jgi:hypothetical protein